MWKLDIGFQKNKTDGTSKTQRSTGKICRKKKVTRQEWHRSKLYGVHTLWGFRYLWQYILDPSTKRRMFMENIYTNVNKVLEDRKLN
jgi:hypothetical protein